MRGIYNIVMDNLDSCIRFGEWSPTDKVLDLVIDALVEDECASVIVSEAHDGDDLLASLTLLMLDASGEDLKEVERKYRRRSNYLLREYARRHIDGYEGDAWGEWDHQCVPMIEAVEARVNR
jgi:hypothetical protein